MRRDSIDSQGVKWIGAVAETLPINAVKRHYDIQLGKMLQNSAESERDMLVPYLKALHVVWGRVRISDLPEMWASPREIVQYGVKSGDLLVCEGGEVGRAGIVESPPEECIIQNALHRVRAQTTANVRYLHYVLHLVSSSGWFDVLCNKATIAHFTREKFSDLQIPIPSTVEQKRIVAFLDRETARLDQLIVKKELQIELLQEKRSALIGHAVTKGLNSKASMKDSMIEWLGEIPEHWQVCLFKRVAKTTYGVGGELDRTLTEGTRILSLPNVSKNGCLVLDNVPYSELPADQIDSLLLRKGDLLFNWRNGSSDHLGKTAYFDLDGNYTHVSFLLRLRFNPELYESKYYQFLLNGFQITGFFASSKAGVNNTFNQSELENLWVMVPPLQEQKNIADYLSRELKQIDKMISKIKYSIATMEEYRTALISAAVTGKVDVSEEAA